MDNNIREIQITGNPPPKKYPRNTIRNQKYTWYSFVFIVIANQFRHFFNIYFFLISFSQCIPIYSVSPLVSNVGPWTLVLVLTLLKEGLDDLKRYARDKEANSQVYKVLRSGGLMSVPSCEIRVGDLIMLEKDERVPADCVLLKTVDVSGEVFIRTDQLDGETDWKLRVAVGCTQGMGSFERVLECGVTVHADKPHKDIYSFIGKLTVQGACVGGGSQGARGGGVQGVRGGAQGRDGSQGAGGAADGAQGRDGPQGGALGHTQGDTVGDTPYTRALDNIPNTRALDTHPITLHTINTPSTHCTESLSLENTLWMNTVLAAGHAMCAVVYTGKETRAMMNTSKPKNKFGLIESELSRYSVFLCTLTVAVATIFTLLRGLSARSDATFIRFVVIVSSVIPISLKVSIDWARYIYGRQIMGDKSMKGVIVRSSNIPEELGRVSYFLSDKTGTLTRNEMEMKKVHLGSVCFTEELNGEVTELLMSVLGGVERGVDVGGECEGEGVERVGMERVGMERGVSMEHGSAMQEGSARTGSAKEGVSKHGSAMQDSEYGSAIQEGAKHGSAMQEGSARSGSATGSALQDTNYGSATGCATAPLHKTLSSRVFDLLQALSVCHNVTPVHDQTITYQAASPDEIAIVQWTTRIGMQLLRRDTHRMVIKDMLGREHPYEILYTFPFTSESKRMGIIVRRNRQIFFFLKGADVVMREIVKSNDWLDEEVGNMAREGLRTLVVAGKRLLPEDLRAFEEAYGSAKLSLEGRNENMARAVAALERDMSILGLTGVEDKLQEGVKVTLETLRNAGISVWMLTGDKIETATSIAISSRLFLRTNTYVVVENITSREEAFRKLAEIPHYDCLVVDGQSLGVLLSSFSDEFIGAACRMQAVVCCRCSPTQKADIARRLRKCTGKRVCCIGDGGNDVSMITEADVGVGIAGKEGNQASLAADFSLERFADVAPLLLWHGRNCYKGTCKLSHFIIHRGTIISVMQAIFCSLFLFSPIALYQGFILVGYVTLYTFFPVFCIILGRDVSRETALKYPELYKELVKGRGLGLRAFATWNVVSFYQGTVIMLACFLIFKHELFSIIAITFSSLIINELLMVFLTVSRVTKVMVVAEAMSLLFYVLSFFLPGTVLVLPCGFFSFLVKVLCINCVAIVFSLVQKMWSRWMSPPSYSKL